MQALCVRGGRATGQERQNQQGGRKKMKHSDTNSFFLEAGNRFSVETVSRMRRALLLTLVFLILLNGGLALAGLPPAGWDNRDAFVWKRKLAWLRDGRLQNVETLIIGDSQAMSGILPAQSSGPWRTVNLALPSMQPEGWAVLLPEIFALPALRRVVVQIGPFSLLDTEIYDSFRGLSRAELFVRNPAAMLRYPYLLENSTEAVEQIFAPLPLVRMRDVFRSETPGKPHLDLAWNPLERIARRQADHHRIDDLLERGAGFWTWNFVGTDPEFCGTATPAFNSVPALPARRLLRDRPGALPAWAGVLRELRARYPVRLVRVPLPEAWRRATDTRAARLAIDAAVAELERAVPGLEVVAPFPEEDFGGGDFHDWTHLSWCGARKFTERLRIDDEQ